MRHPTPRQLSGALLGALAVMSLQGCKRIEMATPKVPAKPSPTAYVDDSVLTSRVRAALLRSPVVNSFNIGIETHEGVVLLSGMAVNTTQIDLAVFVAQTVPGVNSVDSFMFSSGLAAAETTEKAYSVDPGGLTATRPPGQIPPVERSGRGGQPSNTPTPVVQSAGSGYRLRAEVIKHEFERSGPVMHLLLRYTQALITQMAQTAVCNRHHSLDQQLCRWLLLSLDRLQSNQLVMTQELIANMLGVRREGVTEAALKLQRAGLISYARGHINVLDRPGLEGRTCECYDVVKKEYDRLLPEGVAS